MISVLKLIEQLNEIVADNPDLDFSKITVSMNCGEHDCTGAQLDAYYTFQEKKHVTYVDLF